MERLMRNRTEINKAPGKTFPLFACFADREVYDELTAESLVNWLR